MKDIRINVILDFNFTKNFNGSFSRLSGKNAFFFFFPLELVRNELSSCLFVGLMDSPFSDFYYGWFFREMIVIVYAARYTESAESKCIIETHRD